MSHPLPAAWTLLPFFVLVLAMAILPIAAPRAWGRHGLQVLVVLGCAGPVVGQLWLSGLGAHVVQSAARFATFVTTIGALFITTGGIYVTADLEATPRNNVLWLLLGAALASLIGTTGASLLLIRPLLRTNSERQHTDHLVPFFILIVANVGGLLTPLGDPPLLVGYIDGVPFFWTLRLLPVWILYVGSLSSIFYVVDRRAYARESSRALARDRRETAPLVIRGKRNIVWLLAVVPAALLPFGVRELCLVLLALLSHLSTPAEIRGLNAFFFAPIVEVAVLFAGLFVCLAPLESWLLALSPSLPVQASWQLFWLSGSLSAVLDNAPTYAAFTALARGFSEGASHLVAGIRPLQLAAISAGSVVMGGMTYIGNGPNLMVKALAERAGQPLPSFLRYSLFACVALLPAHAILTAVFVLLER